MGEDDFLEQEYELRYEMPSELDDGFGNGEMYTDCDECGEMNCQIVDGMADTVCSACSA